MRQREAVADAFADALDQLPGQADFGHQVNNLLAGIEVRADQAQVYLRLAAAGNTVQQVDSDLLDQKGLDPEGALYKMFNGVTSSTSGVEKKTRRHENNSDLQALVDGVRPSNPNRARFLFDHIDIPAMINYATAGIVSQDCPKPLDVGARPGRDIIERGDAR